MLFAQDASARLLAGVFLFLEITLCLFACRYFMALSCEYLRLFGVDYRRRRSYANMAVTRWMMWGCDKNKRGWQSHPCLLFRFDPSTKPSAQRHPGHAKGQKRQCRWLGNGGKFLPPRSPIRVKPNLSFRRRWIFRIHGTQMS